MRTGRSSTLTAVSRTEIVLFVREPVSLVFTLALPVVMLFVLGGVFGDSPDPDGVVYRGVGAMTYYVPAYIALVVASVGIVSLPTHLAGYRELGVLRRFEASGVPAWAVLASQMVVTALVSLVGALLVIGFGWLVFRPELAQGGAGWLGAAVAFAAGVVGFSGIGLLLGSVLPTARAAQGAGVLLWFVLLIIGGAGPPPEVLTDAMRLAGELTPLQHLVVALQDPWLGLGWNWAELALITGVGLVCGAVAVRLLRWR